MNRSINGYGELDVNTGMTPPPPPPRDPNDDDEDDTDTDTDDDDEVNDVIGNSNSIKRSLCVATFATNDEKRNERKSIIAYSLRFEI